MDPQKFVRLSIGSLGLRIPVENLKNGRGTFLCEIRLRGFPVQRASVPLMSAADANPQNNAAIFYLEESDMKALAVPGCFEDPHPYLEIVIYTSRKGSYCGASSRKQEIGLLRIEVGSEWGKGKPSLIHNGWTKIGKKKQDLHKRNTELHVTVKLDPDPRYIFHFEEATTSNPQIFQVQGTTRQPIFSCKFSQDRRALQQENMGNYWLNSNKEDNDVERRERKGWKIVIHDLSGFAAAAAFMATPFVPSMGCDRVSRSNPGSWLILRPDPMGSSESWLPWGRLEAWRESGPHDSIHLRFHLLPEGQEAGVLVSELTINAEKGGEFFIDMDRQTPLGTPIAGSQASNCEYYSSSLGPPVGGFVMNCKVQGEEKCSKPVVQLAMRHVTCMEDAAIFIALSAAVDLSIKACRPFRRNSKKSSRLSFLR